MGIHFKIFILFPFCLKIKIKHHADGGSAGVLAGGAAVLGIGRYLLEPKRAITTLPMAISMTRKVTIQPTQGMRLAANASKLRTKVPMPASTAAAQVLWNRLLICLPSSKPMAIHP
jgi:hypothetical protein